MKKLKSILLVFLITASASGAFAVPHAADSLATIEPRVSNFDKLKIAGPVDI
ncbi:MAG: hypothetical protein JSU01_07545, partial [Bacteroidetes bacterium]|nr:hypothetical protein [Bacteroidota bacterium]